MQSISNFFKTATGTFALLPGIVILITNLGVPPTSSTSIFSATIEALGVLTLMILWMNRNTLATKSAKDITRLAIVGCIIFITSFSIYLFFYGYLIEDVPNSESIFFPLWSDGDLNFYLEKFGSRSELIVQLGRDDVVKLIQSSSRISILITTILFLFVYQLTFVSLTFSFGILAIKSGNMEQPAANNAKVQDK